MKSYPLPFDSDALRANLASTAQDVVVPDRYAPLFEAVEGLYGVRTALSETLAEYFHTFRNTDLLIDGFQTTLLRNWPYFERSADRTRIFELLAELVLGLLEAPLDREQYSLLLRGLLTWCGEALKGGHGDAYDDALGWVGESLGRHVERQPDAFLEREIGRAHV